MNTPLNPWFHHIALLLLLGAAGAGAGCASSARYSVAAELAAPDSSSRAAYRVVLGSGLALGGISVEARDQLVADVRTALSSRGWYEVPRGVAAAVEIEVDLEQQAPVWRTHSVMEPVYAVVPAPRSRDPGLESSADSPRKIGEREVVHTTVVYPRTLHLVAREVADERGRTADTPIWRVRVDGEGIDALSARDLRWMVAAAMDWLGRGTDAPRSVVVRSSDRRVAFLARGMDRATRGAALAGEESRARADCGT